MSRLTIAGGAVVLGACAAGLLWFLTSTGGTDESSSRPLLDEPGSLAAIFPRRSTFEYDAPRPGTYALPVVKQAPDGELVDHHGTRIRLAAELAGRFALVSFIYLNCADAEGCPVAMATLYEIHDASAQHPALREHLQLVTVSFDPARDTPEALAQMASALAADRRAGSKLNWRLFTGASPASLVPLLDGYGQSVRSGAPAGQINHLLRMYLLDREGNVRNVYGLGSIDPRLIMTDVETLLLQERAGQ